MKGRISSLKECKLTASNAVSYTMVGNSKPLAREILYTSSQSRDSYRYPYLTVNEISIASEKDIQVSDLDYADIIKDKEPIYGGEAVIEFL